MASSAQIRKNIEFTKKQVSETVNELSDRFHKITNLEEKVRENPYSALLTAVAVGFVIATFNKSFRKTVMGFAFKSGSAALGAYVSKKGISYIAGKIK